MSQVALSYFSKHIFGLKPSTLRTNVMSRIRGVFSQTEWLDRAQSFYRLIHDEGSVVYVNEQKAPDDATRTEVEILKPANEASLPESMTGHVLIIDDEEALLAIVSRSVSKRFQVTAFEDAREALRCLQEGAQFDCIICDLMMPNVDGLEFYEKLAEVSPAHLDRIFFLTGGSFSSRTDEFLNRPEIEWREKPISGKELIRAIEETILKSRVRR